MAIEEVHTMSLTTKPTSRLESLSTEVLQSICAHFCRHCRGDTLTTLKNYPWTYETTSNGKITVANAEPAQDLCALSRVSRRLRDVAQPVLYHEFPNFERRERRLEPFLDAVTSRPDLARAVKVMAWNSKFANDLNLAWAEKGYHQGLDVLGTDEDQVWRGRRGDRLQLKHYKALLAFLFGDKYNDTRSYDSHLWRVACAEILILLLALLPNLTTLVADDEYIDMFLSPSALRVYGANSIKLKQLVATHLPHVILDVAPDLQDLVIGHYNPRKIIPPGPSTMAGVIVYLMPEQDFKLEEAPPYRLDTRDLMKVLTFRRQSLLSFWFQTSRIKSKVDVPRPSFSYLDNFCTTLESLHLDYDVHARLFGSTIRSLKKFTSLKEHFITANLIYSTPEGDSTRDANSLVNFLPDQIEIFTVTDWTAPPSEHQTLAYGFDGLLNAMIKGSFPKLRRVRYESIRWQKVRQIYRQVGNVIEAEDSMLRR